MFNKHLVALIRTRKQQRQIVIVVFWNFGCFLVLRKLLFVSFCVVVWVLFSVFSIFCITSLVSATPRNHRNFTVWLLVTLTRWSYIQRFIIGNVYTLAGTNPRGDNSLRAVLRGASKHIPTLAGDWNYGISIVRWKSLRRLLSLWKKSYFPWKLLSSTLAWYYLFIAGDKRSPQS